MPRKEVAVCYQCGESFEISSLEPFERVECPGCKTSLRAKVEFGAYELQHRLNVGGMSVVFIAKDPTLGREVAVKILNKEYSTDEVRMSAFEHEARMTAAISHPNVVRVFTTGRAFGRFFIAMEYVTGGHLEDRITRSGRIPERQALKWAREVAEGLRAARHGGLIHRDVKPGNILIDRGERAKLVDFGLALVTKGGKATATEIWATPYYVSPETIEGREEDFRSDLYGFGATFYHALAGRPSCDELSMDTHRLRRAKQLVVPLGEKVRGLTPETCQVVDRCMSYDPAGRFESYGDLLEALDAALAAARRNPAEVTDAKPSKDRAGRRSRARRGQRWAVGAAILVVLAVVLFFLFGPIEAEQALR